MQRSHLAEDPAMKSKNGGVWLHIDNDLLDFHVTVDPRHAIDDLRFVLDLAKSWGLGLLDQDECEPEILGGDRIRLYLKTLI
ncbi:hypothetical protein ACIOGZ_08010 [Kitasatospora sp. NPDC088160]|uniref:hypothetical protein n=1 Tax=Kitasatospora sp. NPDC088160 TaxID=3364072 RepID=UPI0037F1C04B